MSPKISIRPMQDQLNGIPCGSAATIIYPASIFAEARTVNLYGWKDLQTWYAAFISGDEIGTAELKPEDARRRILSTIEGLAPVRRWPVQEVRS